MYPTLFHIFGFRIDTYSVLWFIGLSLAIIWSIKRLKLYDINEDEARTVMAVSFFFILLGARMPEYIFNWKVYYNNPSLLLDLNRGGLHEIGAVIGGITAGFLTSLYRKKISFLKLCEAAAIPSCISIIIGRWGCFFNGCCVGLRSKSFFAVHFPFDKAGVTRHPVQIYYSVIMLITMLILLKVEQKIRRSNLISQSHSVIAPLALILYSLMRFSMIYFRDKTHLFEKIFTTPLYIILAVALPFECLWLMYGLRRLKSVKSR